MRSRTDQAPETRAAGPPRSRTDAVLDKTKPLFGVLDIVVKLAYANLLWIGTTVLGLVVFGIWPATYALFATVDDLLLRREPVTWHGFLAHARTRVVRANLAGWSLSGTGFVLGFYLLATSDHAGVLAPMLRGALLVVLLLYCCAVLYLMPALLRTNARSRRLAGLTMYLVLARPLHTLTLAIVPAALVLAALFVVPAGLVFFGASGTAYLVLVVAGHALRH